MSAFEEQPVVGLFGSCGDTTFRQDLFIPAYNELGINYFNPQVAPGTWDPTEAPVEADHLAHDVVQCWPVPGSTYALGSMAEQGFSIASTLRAPTPLPKFVISMIEPELSPNLTNQSLHKESLRVRQLTAAHIRMNPSPNVYQVDSLEEMLEVSITLYGVAKQLVELARGHNPAFQRFMESRAAGTAFHAAMASGRFGNEAAQLAHRAE